MEKAVQVIDTDYVIEDGEVTVRCFCKSEDGENILMLDKQFLPYLYVVPEESEGIEQLKEKIEQKNFQEEGEPLPVEKIQQKTVTDLERQREVLKVYTNIPPRIPKLKNKLWDMEEVEECREFDIPFYRRYLIDKDIRPGEWIEVNGEEVEKEGMETAVVLDSIKTDIDERKEPDWSILAFDLEVYKDQIIMASVYGENYRKLLTTEDIDKEYVETVEDEEQLIRRLVELVREKDVDVLTGYNTDEYDFDVLRERSNRHGVDLSMGRDGERMKFNRRGRFKGARLKGRMHLDIYPFIEHVVSPTLESETLDLDSVAEELLGENKDDLTWEQMKRSWREKEDLETFAEYALKDSELAFKLAEELVPQIIELSKVVGLIPFDACRLTYGQLTENYLLREAHQRQKIAPNRPSQQKRQNRRREGAYAGGFVYEPEPGLHEEIAVLDFKSLYPTVMVSHNISPDTLNLEDCDNRLDLEEFDYNFCQDRQGFFPELVEDLVVERSEIKERIAEKEDEGDIKSLKSRSSALKVLANSFYGYLGYNSARWYSRECAEATTYLGREHIQQTIEKAEEMGFEVCYGDTDSVFLKKKDIEERIDSFIEEVNSNLPSFMKLENEGLFVRGFFTSTDSGGGAKKKYALMNKDGGMKITGFEQVRRDWSPIAKSTQKEVLRKVLKDDVEGAAELVKDTIDRLKKGEVPVEDLRIYTTLTKKPENYDSTAPHVEAAKKAIDRGEDISPEDTISYVITRGGGTISDRAELTKFAEDYDSEYYIENQVLPVTLRVLKVFGYTEGQLKGEGKQSGLGRFG